MELLGIVASPRRMGNCELIVKAIAEKVPAPARLRIVRLAEKEIRPCKACYRCLAGDCALQDDFQAVMGAILSADALIVSAPTYLRGANSSLQRFLDRGLQFWKHIDELDGKPAVAVAVAGVQDGEGHALLGVENFLRGMGMAVKGRAVLRAALPGEVLLTGEGKAAAAALAEALAAPGSPEPASPSCSECGGTYFEFRGGNRIFCLLCGAGGSVLADDGGGTRIRTAPPAHVWRGDASMHAHGEWLREMRERYLKERTRLKDAARPYAGGEFV